MDSPVLRLEVRKGGVRKIFFVEKSCSYGWHNQWACPGEIIDMKGELALTSRRFTEFPRQITAHPLADNCSKLKLNKPSKDAIQQFTGCRSSSSGLYLGFQPARFLLAPVSAAAAAAAGGRLQRTLLHAAGAERFRAMFCRISSIFSNRSGIIFCGS